jgi:hypothetical protein
LPAAIEQNADAFSFRPSQLNPLSDDATPQVKAMFTKFHLETN